jgi:hypothetical protein
MAVSKRLSVDGSAFASVGLRICEMMCLEPSKPFVESWILALAICAVEYDEEKRGGGAGRH